MNNPTPWLNTVISERPPMGGEHNGLLIRNVLCPGVVRVHDAFWQAQLLPSARETSTWVLIKTIDCEAQKNRSLHERLNEIGALEPDWDGDDAPAIDPQIVQSAHRMLDALPGQIQVDASPNTNGTISLYLTVEDRCAELEIGRTRYGWAAFVGGSGQASASQYGSVDELLRDEGIAPLLAALGVEEAVPAVRAAAPISTVREHLMAGGGVRFNISRFRTLEPTF